MTDEAMIIPIVGMLIPIVVVPTALVVKHLNARRQLRHTEQMRALELGQPLPVGGFWPALAAILIGFGVPVGTFFIAWMASLAYGDTRQVFLCAAVVSCVAIPCGTWVAVRLFESQRLHRLEPPTYVNGKPTFDPDFMDVVSRRG